MNSEAEVLSQYERIAAAKLSHSTSSLPQTLNSADLVRRNPKRSLALGVAGGMGLAFVAKRLGVAKLGKRMVATGLAIAGRSLVPRLLLSAVPSSASYDAAVEPAPSPQS